MGSSKSSRARAARRAARPPPTETVAPSTVADDDERCPACPSSRLTRPDDQHEEEDAGEVQWIACERCETWFHWDCVRPKGPKLSPDQVPEWHCSTCTSILHPALPSQPSQPTDPTPSTAPQPKPPTTTNNSNTKKKQAIDLPRLPTDDHDPASGFAPAPSPLSAHPAHRRRAPPSSPLPLAHTTSTPSAASSLSTGPSHLLKTQLPPPERRPGWASSQIQTYEGQFPTHDMASYDPQTALAGRTFESHPFPFMSADDLTLEWIHAQPTAFLQPIILSPSASSSSVSSVSSSSIPIEEIKSFCPPSIETVLLELDVASQRSTLSGCPSERWSAICQDPPKGSIHTLRIPAQSDVPKAVSVPEIVRQLDWAVLYPGIVPPLRLCKVAGPDAWRDWHIAPSGASSFIRVLQGSQTTFLVVPTVTNLRAYSDWHKLRQKTDMQFMDMVPSDQIYRLTLHQGQQAIIPSAWIQFHQFTEQTITYEQSFLHTFAVSSQLRVLDLEIVLNVPEQLRFQAYNPLCWAAAHAHLRQLQGDAEVSPRTLINLKQLVNYLMGFVRVIEQASRAKKARSEPAAAAQNGLSEQSLQIRQTLPYPMDISVFVRELRWRVRLAMDESTDEESELARRNNDAQGNRRHVNVMNMSTNKWTKEELTAAPELSTTIEWRKRPRDAAETLTAFDAQVNDPSSSKQAKVVLAERKTTRLRRIGEVDEPNVTYEREVLTRRVEHVEFIPPPTIVSKPLNPAASATTTAPTPTAMPTKLKNDPGFDDVKIGAIVPSTPMDVDPVS